MRVSVYDCGLAGALLCLLGAQQSLADTLTPTMMPSLTPTDATFGTAFAPTTPGGLCLNADDYAKWTGNVTINSNKTGFDVFPSDLHSCSATCAPLLNSNPASADYNCGGFAAPACPQDIYQLCIRDCLANTYPNPQNMPTLQMKNYTQLCSACMGNFSYCGATKCTTSCIQERESADCHICNILNCNDDFMTCSGLNPTGRLIATMSPTLLPTPMPTEDPHPDHKVGTAFAPTTPGGFCLDVEDYAKWTSNVTIDSNTTGFDVFPTDLQKCSTACVGLLNPNPVSADYGCGVFSFPACPQDIYRRCVRDCLSDTYPNPDNMPTLQVKNYTQLCSTCMGNLSYCGATKCTSSCIHGSFEHAECRACSILNCNDDFMICSGLNPSPATVRSNADANSVHEVIGAVTGALIILLAMLG